MVACCCLLASASPAPAGPVHSDADPNPARATWVWGRPDVGGLTEFASGQGVADLFVGAPSDLGGSADLAWFVDLREQTRAAGIRLHALGAEPSWLRHPQHAVDWLRDVTETGLFDGIHLDVEPWARPGWDKHQVRLSVRYLELLERVALASSLPVEVDIAFGLSEVRVDGRRLDRLVLDRVDAVTVMTYRHKVRGLDSITSLGQRSLELGERLGKPVRLAVETNHLGDDPFSRKQTFHGRTRTQLAAALAAVDAHEAHAPAYQGIAVHDADGWAGLAP